MLRGGEIIQQQQLADGVFRPVYMGDRDAWICQRMKADGTTLLVETWGARLNGERFSPMFLFRVEDARKQCDVLNEGGNA